MGLKRKRGGEEPGSGQNQPIYRPAIGTRTFTTGKAVKHGIATSPLQSLIALEQQIHTAHSALPLAISHPVVQTLQQYIDISPSMDEVLEAWRDGDKQRNDKLIESAANALRQILDILSPIPFFRKALHGIVTRLISSSEPYADLLNGLIQSAKRDQSLLGLRLAAAAVHVEPPDVGSSASAGVALKVWTCLVEGGSSKLLGKLLGMRKRTKDGTIPYGERDPLDRPDIRHAALRMILPLLPTPMFLSQVKSVLQPLYSNMPADPPTTVHRILLAIWSAISNPSLGIARKTSLALLDERALEHLLSLLSHHDVEPTSGKPVSEITLAFLEALTSTPGTGICFPDQGWYPRRSNRDDEEIQAGQSRGTVDASRSGLHNRILSNVLRKVGSKAVDDGSLIGEWAVKVFASVPELVAGYWPYSALSLEPRLDFKWISTISYVGRIISLPTPPPRTFHQTAMKGTQTESMSPHSSPPPVATMIESILPSPLTKVHLSKGLQHSHELVQHLTAQTLARSLQKLRTVLDLLATIERELEDSSAGNNAWSRGRYELEMEARRRVPDVLVVIAFAQKSATLARVADDEEAEPAAVARSVMLTEIALRLLGLYHQTLPSITQEMKFDVGKLLVSSSSVKAERRAKKEHRAGSVISDAGSVASVGTMGTAGMGGGFGQDRGDVDGLEALSQAHVLSLLGAAEGWQWSKKAAGSQYTYLYHVLLLHLSTPHAITLNLTTNLIGQLMGSTLMFEHDPGELEIFISSLPRAHSGDIGQRAMALAQQIHILSFLDDCVRRFMKTPYRYIEDVLALGSDYFDASLRPREVFSGLLMTILEQLRAKMVGELISTEAASCIMAYLRRVLLGLCGKTRSSSVLGVYVNRLEQAVLEARKHSQERKGLRSYIDLILRDICKEFGGEILPGSGEEVPEELTDEAQWRVTSFEQGLLYPDPDVETIRLKRLIDSTTPASAERYATFALHLFCQDARSSGSLLDFIVLSMKQATGSHFDAIKATVFNNIAVNRAMESRSPHLGLSVSEATDDLVSMLDPTNIADRAIAQSFIQGRLNALCNVKKHGSAPNFNQILTSLVPWRNFLTMEEAKDLLGLIIEHALGLSTMGGPNGTKSSASEFGELHDLLSRIITTSNGLVLALKHTDGFVAGGLLEPLFMAWKATKGSYARLVQLEVPTRTITKILDVRSAAAFDLITALVEACPSAAENLLKVTTAQPDLVNDPRLFEAFSLALELDQPNDIPYLNLVTAALSTLCNPSSKDNQNAAGACLRTISIHLPRHVNEGILGLEPDVCPSPLAHFARILAVEQMDEARPASLHILRAGLRRAVELISDGKISNGNNTLFLEHIAAAVSHLKNAELDVEMSEPVIIAVIQDALQFAEAVNLASKLCTACPLRASFVRQYLGLLLESKTFAAVSRATNHPARAALVNLIAAFFQASMYAACQPNFIEPLLVLYHGSLSRPDRQILAVFHTFEKFRHLSVGSLLATWSPNGTSRRAFEALTSFDSGRLFKTCVEFPLRRTLNGEDVEKVEATDSLYDPVFVLSILALAVQEPLSGLEWVEILRSNVLGVAICALSSRDAGMRAFGAAVLAKVIHWLHGVTFYEKAQLEHTLRLLRHAMPRPNGENDTIDNTTSRLPTLTTLFFAHTLRAISTPSHPLYASTSQFLLQRPTMDMWDVPMLFASLYASGEGYKRDRSWVVRLIRDGTKSQADWSLLKRRKTVDLLKTLYQSSTDVAFRKLILQALGSVTLVPAAAISLVYKSGMIQWIESQWEIASEAEQDQLLSITEYLAESLAARHQSESTNDKSGFEGGDNWLVLLERLLSHVAPAAGLPRHESLTKIVLRLAPMLTTRRMDSLIHICVTRLDDLQSQDDPSPVRDSIIENLFHATLIMNAPSDIPSPATKRLGELVLQLDSPIGEWTRKELRHASWHAHARDLQ